MTKRIIPIVFAIVFPVFIFADDVQPLVRDIDGSDAGTVYWADTTDVIQAKISLDDVTDPSANKSFTMGSNTLTYTFTNDTYAVYHQQTGDSTPRFAAYANGILQWGSGSAARDVNLYRNAADILKTDDDFYALGFYSYSDISNFITMQYGVEPTLQLTQGGTNTVLHYDDLISGTNFEIDATTLSFETGNTNAIEVDASQNVTMPSGNLNVSGGSITAGTTFAGAGITITGGAATFEDASAAGLDITSTDVSFTGSAGGGGQGLDYEDTGGTQRIMLQVNSNVVALENQASNGTVEVYANTVTAGSGGRTKVATFLDDEFVVNQPTHVVQANPQMAISDLSTEGPGEGSYTDAMLKIYDDASPDGTDGLVIYNKHNGSSAGNYGAAVYQQTWSTVTSNQEIGLYAFAYSYNADANSLNYGVWARARSNFGSANNVGLWAQAWDVGNSNTAKYTGLLSQVNPAYAADVTGLLIDLTDACDADATVNMAGLRFDMDDTRPSLKPFIDFDGTYDNTQPPSAGNLTTWNSGGGSVIGPISGAPGWAFDTMIRIEVNGSEYWVCAYEFTP